MARQQTALNVAGCEVVITNPGKVFFPQVGHTKLDLAKSYAAVADGALRGIAAQPAPRSREATSAEEPPWSRRA